MKIRNIDLGAGIPKICAPLVSETLSGLIEEAALLQSSRADLAEWRVDYFDSTEHSDIMQALRALRIALGDVPLLFTFRTLSEGGKRQIGREEYFSLLHRAAVSGFVDLLDIELSPASNHIEITRELITTSHGHSVITVFSHHDFEKTPDGSTMLGILEKMLELGCDIPKLAVMPECFDDVLSLLRITSRFSRQYPDIPVITMSMGKLGQISRVAGEAAGCAVSFAALTEASAPGQLAADDLRMILEILHRSQ